MEITRVDGQPVLFKGAAWEVLVETPTVHAEPAIKLLACNAAAFGFQNTMGTGCATCK